MTDEKSTPETNPDAQDSTALDALSDPDYEPPCPACGGPRRCFGANNHGSGVSWCLSCGTLTVDRSDDDGNPLEFHVFRPVRAGQPHGPIRAIETIALQLAKDGDPICVAMFLTGLASRVSGLAPATRPTPEPDDAGEPPGRDFTVMPCGVCGEVQYEMPGLVEPPQIQSAALDSGWGVAMVDGREVIACRGCKADGSDPGPQPDDTCKGCGEPHEPDEECEVDDIDEAIDASRRAEGKPAIGGTSHAAEALSGILSGIAARRGEELSAQMRPLFEKNVGRPMTQAEMVLMDLSTIVAVTLFAKQQAGGRI